MAQTVQRLQRVASLEIKHLTLEGLDWQLPLLLADALPNIRQAMQAVKSDNRTIKPLTRAEILDSVLLEKIETVYAHDKELYERASVHWQPWLKYHPEVADNNTMRCFSAKGYPINCVVTLKSGGTYLRNLLYRLEHGQSYEAPLKIHTEGASTTSDLTKAELANEVSFFVVRDPVDRLFSLYFDKVYGTGKHSFAWITERLVAHRGFVQGDNLTLEQHQNNVVALLQYIARKFSTENNDQLNQHWSPQVFAADKAIRFGLQPLLLENLEQQLLQIAGGRIEGLEVAMLAMPHQNRSAKPFTVAELLTPEIAQRISALYGDDQALYERVKAGWRDTGQPPILQDYYGKT